MELNKKGMFFTLIAISLLSLFLISMTVITNLDERESINKRIVTMNNFVNSLEEDLPRKLYISGYRIIFLYEKRILESGNYISDVNASFSEAFFNGTIEGSINSEEVAFLEGVRFLDIEQAINEKSSKVNLRVDLENPRVEVDQIDPWNVHVSLVVDLSVADENNLASWNSTKTVEAFIPTENFEDPIYLINFNGLYAPRVNQTPYTIFVDEYDVTNILDHIEKGYYINSTDGPSFLMRLEGNLSSSIYGVESLINLQKVSDQGFTIEEKSVRDHVYFSEENPDIFCDESNVFPSWFRIEDEDNVLFNYPDFINLLPMDCQV